MRSQRPPLFRKRKFEPIVIVTSVRWYCRFCLSLRDVEEFVAERGLSVDHTTVWRWVQSYGPEIRKRLQHQVDQAPGIVEGRLAVRNDGRRVQSLQVAESELRPRGSSTSHHIEEGAARRPYAPAGGCPEATCSRPFSLCPVD